MIKWFTYSIIVVISILIWLIFQWVKSLTNKKSHLIIFSWLFLFDYWLFSLLIWIFMDSNQKIRWFISNEWWFCKLMNHLSSKLKIQKSQTDIREQIQTVKHLIHTDRLQEVCVWHSITAFMISRVEYTALQNQFGVGHMVHSAQPRALHPISISLSHTHTRHVMMSQTSSKPSFSWRDMKVTDGFLVCVWQTCSVNNLVLRSGIPLPLSSSSTAINLQHTHTHSQDALVTAGKSRSARHASDLLMMPLICESFSICCCRRRLSLSSSRLWYCSRILLVCCSCDCSRRSYSSSFRCDIIRRSFREWISSSYSRTCTRSLCRTTLQLLHAQYFANDF